LYSAIFDNPQAIEPKISRTIEVASEDLAYLMFDWLKELLYQFDCDAIAYSRFDVDVHVQDGRLTATVWGEQVDTSRHFLTREVKAITYHDLTVEKTADGWLAEVIVDI
jgi:SHS2 domain-containing protein